MERVIIIKRMHSSFPFSMWFSPIELCLVKNVCNVRIYRCGVTKSMVFWSVFFGRIIAAQNHSTYATRVELTRKTILTFTLQFEYMWFMIISIVHFGYFPSMCICLMLKKSSGQRLHFNKTKLKVTKSA